MLYLQKCSVAGRATTDYAQRLFHNIVILIVKWMLNTQSRPHLRNHTRLPQAWKSLAHISPDFTSLGIWTHRSLDSCCIIVVIVLFLPLLLLWPSSLELAALFYCCFSLSSSLSSSLQFLFLLLSLLFHSCHYCHVIIVLSCCFVLSFCIVISCCHVVVMSLLLFCLVFIAVVVIIFVLWHCCFCNYCWWWESNE